MLFSELTHNVATLPGVGPARARAFAKLGAETVGGLLALIPRRYEDHTHVKSLVAAAGDGEGLIEAKVIGHDYFRYGRDRVLKIVIRDASATGSLVCFGRPGLASTFPPGARIRAYGSWQLRAGELQSSSFEATLLPERKGSDDAGVRGIEHPGGGLRVGGGADASAHAESGGYVPVYPLSGKLTQHVVRHAVAAALDRYLSKIDDEIPVAILTDEHLLTLTDALRAIHAPASMDDVDRARDRLVFGELFLFQLRLALAARARRRSRRRARPAPTRTITARVREQLPFSLTADQEAVLREITADLDEPWPMSRLLQGDVGSGKTLVALLAALHAIERGEQVALLVPTELLARQHARSIGALVRECDVHLALLHGGVGAAARGEITTALAEGRIDLIIGTHALFSDDLHYAHLGLVIIDEQHRFGVGQRERITSRGYAPDVLMMSATPIPRSLALTAFGDSEVSTIRSLPPGRKPVTTRLVRMGNEERVYRFVRRELEAGHQAYFVYPAIEDGTARGLRSATAMYAELSHTLAPFRVGLAHSRQSEEERAATMDAFVNGALNALVATSVVEVGVDVANATCMVIEHAEMFGLAALHQLRGRVGRGSAAATCILVYQEPLTDDAKERLRVLYQSSDGFNIAEEDLRIRGPGELSGFRQSGFLDFQFADIRRDMAPMQAARNRIARLLREDPELSQAEHALLRRALHQHRLPGEERSA